MTKYRCEFCGALLATAAESDNTICNRCLAWLENVSTGLAPALNARVCDDYHAPLWTLEARWLDDRPTRRRRKSEAPDSTD